MRFQVLLSIVHADFPGGARSRTLDEIAQQARQNMTPRGLMVDVGAGTAGPYTCAAPEFCTLECVQMHVARATKRRELVPSVELFDFAMSCKGRMC